MLSIVTDEDEISSYDADTIIKATCLVRLFIYLFLITVFIHIATCLVRLFIFMITVLIHIYIIYYWLVWMSWILRT
jgi:hypothetical protein